MNVQQTRMGCPRCVGKPLHTAMTKEGVEVDHCQGCGGVWLDKGEIFYFVRNAKPLIQELKRAEREGKPGTLGSPKTGKPMLQMRLFDAVEVDTCRDTGGIWLDRGEMQQLVAGTNRTLRMTLDEVTTQSTIQRAADGSIPPAALAAYAAGAKKLPNLFVRSVGLLTFLYALLGIALIAAVELGGLTPAGAVLIGVIVAALQFLLGPFIMDWSLRWFYSCSWVGLDDLPAHLKAFIEKISAQSKIKVPRMGVIRDGSPNAFTYGHHPGNARIVVTQGLLDLLDEKELEAVVAHEVGHAVQWDMLIMTMAQLVPLIAYYLYRTLIRIRIKGKDNTAAARYAIAIGAYLVYIVSEYIVLWLSRTREYKADNFAGRTTGNPNLLASALVKIGYGLAGQEKKTAKRGEEQQQQTARKPNLEAIGALGIFDGKAARAFAVASGGTSAATSLDPDEVKGAMRWDLWNPWAKFYEINSTHPLIAHRLDFLSRQSAAMHLEPMLLFDERRPESYWDEFLVDLFVMFLPLLLAGGTLAAGIASGDDRLMILALSGLGLGMLLKILFGYRGNGFPEITISGLLKKIKVSAVRGVPCTVRGTVIGRGVPGLIWSEDFVIQDDTGIMFLDYRQPLRIWEFLFGLMRGSSLQNELVVATGWYRRAPVPFIELKTLTAGGRTRRCYAYHTKLFFSVLLIAAGILLALTYR